MYREEEIPGSLSTENSLKIPSVAVIGKQLLSMCLI